MKMDSAGVKKRILAMITAGIMSFMCLPLFEVNVYASEGFEIYTMSPGINATAGDTVNYDLYITGSDVVGKDVALSIEKIPDGFSGYFKNSSYEVNKVHVDNDSATSEATFVVSVPVEATDGDNIIIIKGTKEDGSEETLELDLNISKLKSGDSNFTVQYPDQEGVTGTSFTYSTTIVNNSLTMQNYNFATNAPTGWTVTYTSSDKQVSSIDVDSGASAGVTINITPPDKVQAGKYDISCTATSSKERLSTDLNVTILGTYDLEVTTTDGNLALDAYANRQSDITLLIKNNGNIDLNNITLSSQANSNWDISFDQTTIESLKAGASAEVKAHITPSNDSINGDYVTNIVATCDNHSDTAELRVTVKTKTGWGIFAVLIILAVVCGLYVEIRKYGRR